jgi:hypothetical protein
VNLHLDQMQSPEAAATLAVRKFDLQMTKSWPIALFVAGLSSGQAFADCVPSPDTPASVIEYFKSFNKPLPEQFCAKEDAAPQAEASQETEQAYEDSPEQPPLERRDHHVQLPPDYLPIPGPPYPPPYGVWPRHFERDLSRLAYEWLYSEIDDDWHHHKKHDHKHRYKKHKHKHHHNDND